MQNRKNKNNIFESGSIRSRHWVTERRTRSQATNLASPRTRPVPLISHPITHLYLCRTDFWHPNRLPPSIYQHRRHTFTEHIIHTQCQLRADLLRQISSTVIRPFRHPNTCGVRSSPPAPVALVWLAASSSHIPSPEYFMQSFSATKTARSNSNPSAHQTVTSGLSESVRKPRRWRHLVVRTLAATPKGDPDSSTFRFASIIPI